MPHLTIRLDAPHTPARCGLCGGSTGPAAGPQLAIEDGAVVVCRSCGKRHAPSLVALLDLARVAERIGRIGRHTVVPPMGAILDLVKAAEDYQSQTPVRERRAA